MKNIIKVSRNFNNEFTLYHIKNNQITSQIKFDSITETTDFLFSLPNINLCYRTIIYNVL